VAASILPPSRSQELPERSNDLFHEKRIALERFRYVQKFSGLSILDCYASGELACLLYVQTALIGNDVRRALEVSSSVSPVDLPLFVLHFNSLNMPLGKNGDKEPMFVSDVQSVNGPDGMIPSLVRAYLVTYEPKERRGNNIFVGVSEPSIKFFDGLSYGEFCSLGDESRSKSFDSFEPDIIEGAIKVVDGVSYHQGDVIEGSGISKIMLKNFATRLLVSLNSNGIGIVKRADTCFDVVDVMIGPFDFQSGFVEHTSSRIGQGK
jgi:hypothetical protein